jgi:segregation and condensation protein A
MELNIAGHQTGDYTVTTPVYEGPLDLLLNLIEHAELDITVLALAQVTDQYLLYIHRMDVPADEISAFLVVASKLIQIKSEALLPRPPIRQADEENIGETLAEQLRIYKRFKELASWMDARQTGHFRTYLRVAPVPHIEGRLDLSGISVFELVDSAISILAEKQDKEALDTVITQPRITIREKIIWITEKLQGGGRIDFHALLHDSASRLETVVTFLALLELVKRYQVLTTQDGLFGEIHIEQTNELGELENVELEFE